MPAKTSTKKTVKKTAAKKPVTKKTATKKAAKKATPAAKGKKAPASKGAALGLKVRMYRVGFGDFFLVTVPISTGAGTVDRYILIDCGVFKGTTGKGDIGSIEEAVEDLFKTTGGELALVIMTHRHADHIAGFSRAERFKDFKASLVWMPYWEQFNDAKDSASNLQLDVHALALQLAMQFRGRADETAQQAFDQLANATGLDFNAAATTTKTASAKKLSGNAAALDLLKNQLGNAGKNVRYYAAGDKPELPAELAGLTAEILGPPPKEDKAFLALTDLKKNVGQFLDATTDSDTGARALQIFPPQWQADLRREYLDKHMREEAQQLVNNAQPDMLAAAAAKIDTFLNNQSLVVLFQFAGKNLLFVGDAQAGNWEHWLYKLDAPVSDPTKAGALTDKSQQILRTLDFYKVGHHGSTNATPIPVVEALGQEHSANGFVAMCSTQIGVYGNDQKGTEVPRAPLIKALGDECALVRSDSFEITTADGTTIPPADGAAAALPKPKVGKFVKAGLYVEYSF